MSIDWSSKLMRRPSSPITRSVASLRRRRFLDTSKKNSLIYAGVEPAIS